MILRPPLPRQASSHMLHRATNNVMCPHQSLRFAAEKAGFGMTLFDKNCQLQFGNQAYRDLYRLPQRLIDSGTRLTDILNHHRTARSFKNWTTTPDNAVEAWLSTHLEKLSRTESYTATQLQANGTIVEATYLALPEGGWLGVQRKRADMT